MKRAGVWILLLGIALVASNLWWAFVTFDAGVSATYRDASLLEHHEALAQAIAVAPVAAKSLATREEVLAAARRASGSGADEIFEKDGFVWVGRLGYRFGPDGRLIELQTSWSPF